MERLIFVPIERLEERYSNQWYDWFQESFIRHNIDFVPVGDHFLRDIKNGQFLDVIETNEYKLQQLQQIIKLLHLNSFKNCTIFFMDMWFPGIETLAYIRSTLGLNFKIKGMVHAGTWDEWDYLSQKNCQQWSYGFEQSLFQIFDEVFVATEFHEKLIKRYFADKKLRCKFTRVDWPCINPHFENAKKENIVVFPHRLAPEKAPHEFERIADIVIENYPDVTADFLFTKKICKNKDEYYKVLRASKVAVSTARQETFGIAMQEALNMGCYPVVPNRLSYVETFGHYPRYDTLHEAARMVAYVIKNYDKDMIFPKYNQNLDWVTKIME